MQSTDAVPAVLAEQEVRRILASSRDQGSLLGLVGWLAISFAAAAFGGFVSTNAGDFYRQLARPDWAPPGWVFGPVWTVLYLMMGVAAWLVWRQRGFGGARVALALFLVQLVVNALWSWLFFAWKLGGAAFADILILWVLVHWTVVAFWRVRPLAGALLVPYLAWVTYASALAYWVWRHNPSLLG
jgi:translocator protein